MKVLFAVSNEEISETIVKKYQKEYKQIISYKNVYYFNAILKELQKDKGYDRIVISEDLEAFSHTQYDQIDKFIFEKLDSISDEASNSRGNDIPIILICSDRRVKSEQMLVKIFGIGIYNAIIGNDRSVDEVCRLINRPRTKKDAKNYYKIDTEEVNYQAENENDVSEMEIQNIVAHYKRLGKNEDRYIDSFNNIAAQYNDTQLRIITKFLPLNVRAVLEERSPKYQQIMSFNNAVSNNLRKSKNSSEEDDGPSQVLLKLKNRESVISKPVVIPSSVNMHGTKKLTKKHIRHPEMNNNTNSTNSTNINNNIPQEPVQKGKNENGGMTSNVESSAYNRPERIIETPKIEEVVEPVKKRGRGRPRKNPLPSQESKNGSGEKRKRGRPRKNPLPLEETPILPGFEEKNKEQEEIDNILNGETFLPGFDETVKQKEVSNELNNETFLPGFDNNIEEDDGFKQEDNYQGNSSYQDNSYQNNSYQNNNYQDNSYQDNSSYQDSYQDNSYQNNSYQNNSYQNNSYQNNSYQDNNYQGNNYIEDLYNRQNNGQMESDDEDNQNYEKIDLSNLLTPDKKIITFVGTSKNGTSFIVNNIAELISSIGVNTAILDTTKNRNSYYIYTKNEEDLREIASNSIKGLANGIAQGVSVNKNLTVYTSLPNEERSIGNVDRILETLLQNHSLILIDTDFDTPERYFEQSQETYLIQTMDILTIQPLTAFLKKLKTKNILDESKLRVVLNKLVRIRGIKEEVIIGGIAFYNDPAMSFMTELFDKDRMKYVTIPFEDETYIKYLEGIIECEISLKGYSKIFLQSLKVLGNMVYPIIGAQPSNSRNYQPPSVNDGRQNSFSSNMNDTLERMKRNY